MTLLSVLLVAHCVILDDLRPFRELALTNGAAIQDSFRLFPAPDAYLANRKSYQGIRFVAQGSFVGDNRSSGAPLTFWLLPPEEKEDIEKPKPPKEKVKIQIVNATGDTIRTFTRKPKWGMNRISWNLRRDGVDMPSRTRKKT